MEHNILIKPVEGGKIDLNEFGYKQDKMDNIKTLINQIVKRAAERADFKQVGRIPKFFLVDERKEIRDYNLVTWPGYELQTQLYTSGVYLNVDCCTKFIQNKTIL